MYLQRTVSSAPQHKLQSTGNGVVQLYRYPGLTPSKAKTLLRKAKDKASSSITGIDGELCYNVATSSPLTAEEAETLAWLMRETYEPELLTPDSSLRAGGSDAIVEVRLGTNSLYST